LLFADGHPPVRLHRLRPLHPDRLRGGGLRRRARPARVHHRRHADRVAHRALMRADELTAIARRYFPAGVSMDDPRYFTGEPTLLRRETCRRAVAEHAPFARVVETLRARHPDRWCADTT